MPALFGAALALVLIVIGSLAARLIFNAVRRRRRDVARDLPAASWDAPLPRLDESPSIAMARRPDIARDTSARPGQPDDRSDDRAPQREEDGRAPWREPAPRAANTRAEMRMPPSAQSDSAAAIEDSVRDLLQRLRSELQLHPETDLGAQRQVSRGRRP